MKKISAKSINLDVLLDGLYEESFKGLNEISIKGISLDSREIYENFLFFALKGEKLDGNDFINEAFSRGASAVLTDSKHLKDSKILYLPDLKESLGIISSRFYNNPSQNLETFCVTGTNGKTSCVELISQIAKLINLQCGYISTIGISLDGKNITKPSSLTTPNPINLQRSFFEMVHKDSKQVAFEASSHGLEQARIAGTSIDTAILTSFSHDHLDYHKNFESYKNAKKKLFTELKPKNVILNIDNILGKEIYKELIQNKESCSVFTVSNSEESDFYYSFSRKKDRKLNVALNTPNKEIHFSLNTISRPLASNVICAIASFITRGFNLDKVYPLLKDLDFPEGRMELIPLSKKNNCFVDYAHTPEALKSSLIELKDAFKKTNIWCIFGCGGDRDKDKRPLMGEVAGELSDFLIITNDNPRTENEMDIINGVRQGLRNNLKVKIIPNREKAISFCLREIEQNNEKNILLIAGKGHESYQDISGRKLPFSDHEEVKKFLESM